MVIVGVFSDKPFDVGTERIHELVFGESGRTLNTFYQQASGGRTWFSGDLFAFDLGTSDNNPDWSDYDRWFALVNPLVDLTDYRRVVIVKNLSESRTGVGGSDIKIYPTGHGAARLTTCLVDMIIRTDTAENQAEDEEDFMYTLTHECGHALGFPHSNASVCFDSHGNGTEDCGIREYGNDVSNMGGVHWSIGAAQRAWMGWFDPSESRVVDQGNFTLASLNLGSGLKHLQVPLGEIDVRLPGCSHGPASYSLEYRSEQDLIDARMTHNSFVERDSVFIGAQIHGCLELDPFYQGSTADLDWNVDTQVGDYSRAYLESNDRALGAGEGYYDFILRKAINVTSTNSISADVEIRQDSSNCSRAKPTLRELAKVYDGTALRVQIGITNHDSNGCGTSQFQALLDLPNPERNQSDQAFLSVAPGQERLSWLEIDLDAPFVMDDNLYRVSAKNLNRLYFRDSYRKVVELSGCFRREPQLELISKSPDAPVHRDIEVISIYKVTNLDAPSCASRNFHVRPDLISDWERTGDGSFAGRPRVTSSLDPINFSLAAGESIELTLATTMNSISQTYQLPESRYLVNLILSPQSSHRGSQSIVVRDYVDILAD